MTDLSQEWYIKEDLESENQLSANEFVPDVQDKYNGFLKIKQT